MSIDTFVEHVYNQQLTLQNVQKAVMRNQSLISGRHSKTGGTALHGAVSRQNRDLVAALLAYGAKCMANRHGETPVYLTCFRGTADMLRLLIDGGGCVNQVTCASESPLIALIREFEGDEEQLSVLLAHPDIDLDAKHYAKTAWQWAMLKVWKHKLAAIISKERQKRLRWTNIRIAWIGSITGRHGTVKCKRKL
jgi:ankyrin repeat protein